jgi:diacylglycerol kinase family enzyme
LISIANSNQFGNNFTIAPRASLVDGLLDIVIVTRMNKLLLPFSILSQVTGLNARQDVSSELGKKILSTSRHHHSPSSTKTLRRCISTATPNNSGKV